MKTGFQSGLHIGQLRAAQCLRQPLLYPQIVEHTSMTQTNYDILDVQQGSRSKPEYVERLRHLRRLMLQGADQCHVHSPDLQHHHKSSAIL